MAKFYVPMLLACAVACAASSPVQAGAAVAATAGIVTAPSIAASAGLVYGATAWIEPTTWWGSAGKALAVLGGSALTGVLDPPAGTFYNGDFTIHYDSGDLSLVRTGWLGKWGADPTLAAPPVDASGGFPTGASFVLQNPNAALSAVTLDDPALGLITTEYDWGAAGMEMDEVHFNFFGFAFMAKHDIALRYLGTVTAGSAASAAAGLSQANLFVTTNGMFCKPPADNLIQLCGPPETMLFQTSRIPEPAAWSMMLLGFGLIGGLMRRRPKTGQAAH